MSQSLAHPHTLELAFTADLSTVEGILALVQEWASDRGVSYDDRLSLRLALEELLSNICLHASPIPEHTKISLSLEYKQTAHEKEIYVVLQDNGKAFNPLRQSDLPVESIHDTPIGKRGLSLVRLLTVNATYTRASGNQLTFTLSLTGEKKHATVVPNTEDAPLKASWSTRLYRLWKGQLAFRQTILFTLYSFVLIWGGIAIFYFNTQETLKNNALQLGMQTLNTQSVISSTFLKRIQGNLHRLDEALSSLPAEKLFENNAASLTAFIKQIPITASLTAEIPLIGILAGQDSQTWMYPVVKGQLLPPKNMPNLQSYVDSPRAPIAWKTLPITFFKTDRHAAMIYAIPLGSTTAQSNPTSQHADTHTKPLAQEIKNGWIGVVITMPWIENTLAKLTGFTHAAPLYLDHTGHYVIYPPQRQLGEGPQSLREEASTYNLPQLARLEADILAGKKGVLQLTFKSPWELGWTGPTSLVYHPMDTPGWFLALLVDSYELGDAPHPFPSGFIFVAFLGPLLIGCITWLVTYKTLRPLHDLTTAIEKLSEGDTETPFPKAPYPDEVGNMLNIFERVRVTLRTSFHNLIDTATRQQRLNNELAMARNTQESMLPNTLPEVSGTQVAASLDMAYEVCGDLYTCFANPNKPSHLYFVIGDVCNKGIPAALIMSRTVSLAHSFLMDETATLSQTLERLNEALLRNDTSAMFVSMLVATLDTETGVFQWASAGHPPPIIATPHLNEGIILPWSRELVLNVRPQQKYTTFTYNLCPEQTVLLYTDGADEAMSPPNSQQGEIYGEECLIQSFATACHTKHDAHSILHDVRNDLFQHMHGLQPADDISLMVIRWEGIQKKTV